MRRVESEKEGLWNDGGSGEREGGREGGEGGVAHTCSSISAVVAAGEKRVLFMPVCMCVETRVNKEERGRKGRKEGGREGGREGGHVPIRNFLIVKWCPFCKTSSSLS